MTMTNREITKLLSDFLNHEDDVVCALAVKAVDDAATGVVSEENMFTICKTALDAFVSMSLIAVALRNDVTISVVDGDVAYESKNVKDTDIAVGAINEAVTADGVNANAFPCHCCGKECEGKRCCEKTLSGELQAKAGL